jgi:hypothetical protein
MARIKSRSGEARAGKGGRMTKKIKGVQEYSKPPWGLVWKWGKAYNAAEYWTSIGFGQRNVVEERERRCGDENSKGQKCKGEET